MTMETICHPATALREAPKDTIAIDVIWLGRTVCPRRLTPGTPQRSKSERMMLHTVPDLNIEDSSLPPRQRLVECAMQFLPPSADEAPYLVSVWAEQIGAGFGLGADETSRHLLERLYRLGIGRFEAWLGVLASEGHVDEGEVVQAASILSAACDGFMLQMAAGEVDLEQVRSRLERLCALIVPGEH